MGPEIFPGAHIGQCWNKIMVQGISSTGALSRPAKGGMNIFQRTLKNIATLFDIRAYKTEMDRYEGELRQQRQAK